MKKLSTRFAIMMALAGVVPLLAYGGVALYSVLRGTTDTLVDGNLNVAQQVGGQIERYVTSSVRMLTGLALQLQQVGLVHWQQDRILQNYVLDSPEFKSLTLLDVSGRALVSSDFERRAIEIPGSDAIQIGDALISRFTIDEDFLPSAVVAIRLDAASGGGWLVGRLNLEELWRMVDRIHIGEEGRALVVSKEGTLLAHGSPNAKTRVAQNENIAATNPLIARAREASAPPRGVWGEYADAGGQMFGVATQLNTLGWTVVVEQPVTQAFAVPNATQWQLSIAIAVALMAMLGVGYVWGRSFIVPILRLTRATSTLADGHLDERVTVQSKDEIGQLGNAFNNMADKLVQLQDDLVKKERQATFGRVAVGLVHDLSNPIQNIGNACKMIVMMFDDLEYRESFKRTVEREFTQVKRMLDDLRNIAKPMPLQRFPFEVNKALREIADSMQPTAEASGLTLETALAGDEIFILGDLFALNRVYRNLVTNAFQATPPQGRVTIRSFKKDDYALIEIADTGSGIPPDRLASIFEDFVTTKKRGLGLGLAMAKRVVEQLGGTISVASEVGTGTTFTLRFPLTKARPEQLTTV